MLFGTLVTYTMQHDTISHYRYTVILEPQIEGGYTVHVPALPEVTTQGDTETEALEMAKDAIGLAVAYRRDNGMNVPTDPTTQPAVRTVTLAATA